jgi:hypothetical protein
MVQYVMVVYLKLRKKFTMFTYKLQNDSCLFLHRLLAFIKDFLSYLLYMFVSQIGVS